MVHLNMTHLYILTDSDKIQSNKYKVGIHSGDINSLLRR